MGKRKEDSEQPMCVLREKFLDDLGMPDGTGDKPDEDWEKLYEELRRIREKPDYGMLVFQVILVALFLLIIYWPDG